MSWVLVAALLAVEPEPVADVPEEEPVIAVWMQPIGSFVRALPLTTQTWYLALGVTVAVSKMELAVELTGWDATELTLSHSSDPPIVRRALMLAVGPMFHTGQKRFGGFFVEPKVVAELGYRKAGSPFGSVQLGATAGWQLRWRYLYLAICLGATVGAGSEAGNSSGPFSFHRGSSWGLQWGLDFNLLRIGIAL